MDQTICSRSEEQEVSWTEEPKTSHITGGSDVIKESSGTTHQNDLESKTTLDFAASTFLSQYELLNDALEPADAEWTPEDLFVNRMGLDLYEPSWQTEVGPVIPSEFTEDVLLNGEVGVIPEHAPLAEGPSRSFRKPEDTPVTVPVLDSTSLFPVSETLENVDITSPDIEDILSSDLDSFQPQLEAHEWLQENDQGPFSMSGLHHCLSHQCFEAEKATVMPNEENLSKGPYANSQPQFGLTDPLYDTELEWEEQASQAKSQQKLLCSTQASQPQHFPDSLGQAPSSCNSLSTHPHLNSGQHPVLLDLNYPQPTQLLNSTFFPLGTPSDVNYEYLPLPVVHDTRFNLASSIFENSSPLVPQVDLNSGSSVSPLNPNHPYHTLPLYCKYPQMNISCHLPHPNPQTPFWPGSLEQPPVGESRYAMDSLSQKFYVNYRLWQMYCKVTKSVYASSPDAEALACFFIPVIRSVCLQCPEIFFVEAVKAALSEWEKHSNFDRMDYYHTAQKFMEFEEENLKHLWAVDQAAAHQEAAQQKQTADEQPGCTPKPSSSKVVGSSVQKAKGDPRKFHGAQALRKTVQELAEEAQRAYGEIMEDLEKRNKKQSEDAKDEEEVHEEEEEDSFTEYLNELCSQTTFLNEAGADIDMEYISSLLSSDLNPTDMLTPPEVQDNAQNASTGVTLVPETGHLNLQTTAESISARPPEELHPPPQTFSAHFSPTLQPGLCMSDGKILPPLASFKIPAFLNRPNLMNCPSINPEVPLTSKQFQVPASCSGIHFPPFQNFIPQKTFEMMPPSPGPLSQSQMASGGPSTLPGHFFPANCFTPSMLIQEDVGSFNRHDAFRAIPPTTISSSCNQDRKNLTLPLREIKAQNKNQNHSDLQNVHLWPPVTSQMPNDLQSSVPHQCCQSNSSGSLSLENGSSQNATEPAWIFMGKNGTYYTSSQMRPAIADLGTKDSRVGSVSKPSSQEVEQSQSIVVDSSSRNHQSTDTNDQVMAQAIHKKQKSDSSDVDTSKIITVGNGLMASNKENENRNTFVEKQKVKESMPDIQEDNDGTYSALFLEKEAKAKTKTVEQVCSDRQQLLEESLNESVDHQAGRLLELTCTPSCSDQDSPTSTRPPVILSPLSFTLTHLETPKEISETCLATSKEKDGGQLSIQSMYKEGTVSSIQYPCSAELSNLPCDVKTDCSSRDPTLKRTGNCFTDVSETKLGQKHFYIPSNDLTLDVLSDPIFISNNTDKNSFIEKASSGSLNCTSALDKTKSKSVNSKTVVIPLSEMDQILQDASQTEERLNTSTQPGAATDYKSYFNDPQHFSLEEPVHVPTNESSQFSTVTVTQNQSTKHDPVTNDHSGKMREPITRPDKTQEEYLVNTANVLDGMDLDVPPELSAIKLESTSNNDDDDDDDDDDNDPKLAAHLLLSLKDVAEEIPLELVDRGLQTDGSLKDGVPNGTKEDTETKEATEMNREEIGGQMDSEGTLAFEDDDKVSSEKSKNAKRKMPHIGKQAYVKNKVQADDVTGMTIEMLSTTVQEGNTSTGEKTTAEDRLCMSEEKLGQDPKTEASLHEQDRSSTPKNMSLITKNEEMESSSGNKRQSGPTETPNQCDDRKTRIGDGRESENVSTSAKAARMKEKTIGTDNGEKELTLKKTKGNRRNCQETFHSVTNEKNPTGKTDQKLENSSVALEKGQSKSKCNLKNKKRHMQKERLQREENSLLTKKTGTMTRATKKPIMRLQVSSFLSEAPSESQDSNCNSTKTFESAEEREQKKSKENQTVDSHRNTSKEKLDILKQKRRRNIRQSTKKAEAEVAQKVKDQRNESVRSAERCNSKKHKRESVKNSKFDCCFVMNTRRKKRTFESMRPEVAAETPDVKKNPNAGNRRVEGDEMTNKTGGRHSLDSAKLTGRRCERTLATKVKDIHRHLQIQTDEESRNIIASSKTSSLVAMPTRKTRISGTSQVKSTVTAKKQVKPKESVSEIIACNGERTQKEKVNEKPVKNHNDDAQLSKSTSRMSSCGASMAEETAEKHAKINKRHLSSLASEGNDSERCGRRLKSDASVFGISVRFKNKSKDTTKTKRRDTISGHGKGRTHNQGSDGNRQERKQTRTWTASQRIQFEQREKESKSLDEGISKSSPDQKAAVEMSREGRGVEEMQKKWKSVAKEEKTDKREAGVKRCRSRRSAESSITTAEQEMIRKEAERGITGCSHEQRELHQQSRRQCRDSKSQVKSRFLRKGKPPLVLEAPETRQCGERTNDGQKESLTRAKEVNSKRIIESLPIRKQKLPEELTSGFKIETANLKTLSSVARDIPSSSQTPRKIRKGSPPTSDGPRERRAEKKGQPGSVRVPSVHCKETDQENGGNKWKRRGRKESERTESARENGQKAQADSTEAIKIENKNEKQKKPLKGGGIRVRWSDRLGKKQRKRPR